MTNRPAPPWTYPATPKQRRAYHDWARALPQREPEFDCAEYAESFAADSRARFEETFATACDVLGCEGD